MKIIKDMQYRSLSVIATANKVKQEARRRDKRDEAG
jgi:hypothetical protein